MSCYGHSQVCKKANHANLKLIQAGGNFSSEQRKQIQDLGLVSRVEQRQNLTREDLARLYRGTKCLVITSDAEGFGLPVIEGLSCGARIVASDIPALREVGGNDVDFFPSGDFNTCAQLILNMLERQESYTGTDCLRWSWSKHANSIFSVYETLTKI